MVIDNDASLRHSLVERHLIKKNSGNGIVIFHYLLILSRADMESSSIVVFLVLTSLLLYLYAWWQRYRRDQGFDSFAKANQCVNPSTIPSSFLNGITHKWKRLRHQRDLFDDYMNEIFTRNGPTHAVAKGSSNEIKMIYTIEPANIRTMLSTNFSDYHRPQTMPNALNPVMGRGVFTSNGAEWAHSRGLVRAQFSIKRIRHVRKLEVHVQNIFEALGDVDEESGWTAEQEILSIFDRFTLDAATEFMFGTSAASHEAAMARRRPSSDTSIRARQYKNNRPGFRAVHSLLDWLFGWSANSGSFGFGDAFDLCLDYVALRLKLGKLWFLADGIAFRLACKQVQRYADDYIREAAAHADEATRLMEKDPLKDAEESEFKDSRIGDDDRKYGLISDLVESYPDKIALRNQVMQLLVAGRDTTAASLTWTFALLEANPQVLQRLIDNIMETFGTESQPRQTINYDTLRACTYLQWVIFEVLRLYPTGPLNARMASCNTVLPLGGGKDGQSSVAVKAGTTVAYNTYLLHRRKEFWGDDAWEFRPERWENRRVGWDYIPFHGGPQTCLGQQHALTEMAYVIVRIFQRFDHVQSSTRASNFHNGIRTILVPKYPVLLQFRRRQADGNDPREDRVEIPPKDQE